MRRTQVYLDEELAEELHSAATTEGRSAAAVIREALRRYLSEHTQETHDPILDAIGSVTGLPSDAAESHDRDLYGSSDPPVAARS